MCSSFTVFVNFLLSELNRLGDRRALVHSSFRKAQPAPKRSHLGAPLFLVQVRIIPLQLQRLFAQLLLLDQEAASTADLTDSFGWTSDEVRRSAFQGNITSNKE